MPENDVFWFKANDGCLENVEFPGTVERLEVDDDDRLIVHTIDGESFAVVEWYERDERRIDVERLS